MQPEATIFFVDRSLGKHQVPEALRAAGAAVELHDDHFPIDMQDENWIREIGRRGWVILTKDSRIRYRPLEHAAVRASHARLFVLTTGNTTGPEMAKILVDHLTKMLKIAADYPPPFIARVSRSGIRVDPMGR